MTTVQKVGLVVGSLVVAAAVVALVTVPNVQAQWVSALAAVVATLAAIVTASISARTLGQVTRDSQASNRPMVVAWLRRSTVHGYQDLVVSNVGRTIARNIQVSFEPELPAWAATDPVAGNIVERYREPIGVLVPGQELANIYSNPAEVPAPSPPGQITVRIAYDNGAGDSYEDDFPLDVELINRETIVQQRSRRQ